MTHPNAAPPSGDDPARRLNRRYLACFAVVLVLLPLNQVLVQPQLLALAIDPPTINQAGRQRMLSQRLAKAALAIVRDGPEADRRRYLGELEQVRSAWSSAHERLRRGPGAQTPAVRAGLLELEPSFTRLQAASSPRWIRSSSRPRARPGRRPSGESRRSWPTRGRTWNGWTASSGSMRPRPSGGSLACSGPVGS